MKLACRRSERTCADGALSFKMMALMVVVFGLLAITLQAQPSWWTSRGAVNSSGANDYAVVNEGQLKQFTQKAVLELNANLPVIGAGPGLNGMVNNWQNEYVTGGFTASNPKPSDLQAMNVGQLKYIGQKVWTQLVAGGYADAPPTWLAVPSDSDSQLANIGQLKTVFNFDLASWHPLSQLTSPSTADAPLGIAFNYSTSASFSPTGYSATGLPPGLSINGTTGAISGTPTTSGVYPVNLSITNTWGTNTAVVVINVASSPGSPVINSPTYVVSSLGLPLSYQIAATNSPVHFGATSLPTGLSVDTATGIISGAVSISGSYTIGLSAVNGSGAGTATLQLVINGGSQGPAAAPNITSSLTASIAVGGTFSYTITASNSPTSYGATGLPAGLSVSTSSGSISGIPTNIGTYPITISATNTASTTSNLLTLTVGSATPVIISETTVTAVEGSLFRYNVTASGGATSYSATPLPAGLAIDTTTGIISGTPTSTGVTSVVLHATNTLGYGAATLTLTVISPDDPAITSSTSADATVGQTFTYEIEAANSPTSFSASGLPTGLSVNTTTGVITGTPTATGVSTITLGATNTHGSSTATLTLTVAAATAPVITSSTSANATTGQAFSYNIQATGNPTSYGITTTLPAGLTINTTTGIISGTPTTAATTNITLTATNGIGTGTATLALTVFPPGPGIASPLTASAVIGQSFSYELYTRLGDATSTSVMWQSPQTTLPTGLSYTDHTTYGILSGTPTAPGVYNITLSATDPADTNTATLVLNIGGITSASTASAQVGTSFSFTVADADAPTAFQATNLPAGLSISTAGVISGTPLAADTVPVYLSVTDGVGVETSTLLLSIAPQSSDSQISFQRGVSPTAGYTVLSGTIASNSSSLNTGSILTVGESSSSVASRALLSFDLSALPANATITSASLVVRTSSGDSSGAGPIPVEVHQTSASFTSAAEWSDNREYNVPVLSSLMFDPSAASASKTFPIQVAFTQAVQRAYNDGSPIYLTLVAPSVEGASTVNHIGFVTNSGTASQNPQLVVTYTVGTPPAPVITSATTATGTVSTTFSYTITATNNPQQFSATGLPTGLGLDTTTGLVSGTVTTVGSTVATVNATNSTGTGSQQVTFNIDNATPATSLTLVGGNNQVGAANTVLAQPLVVRALHSGSALANALVTFTVPPGQGTFTKTGSGLPATSNTLTVVTDGSGNASVDFLLPQSVGPISVVASAGTATPLSLTEYSSESNSTSSDSIAVLSIVNGTGQSGASGAVLGSPFVVQARDISGQPLTSLSLTLKVVEGNCQVSTGGSYGTTQTVTTNGSGQATINLKLGSGPTNGVSCAVTTGSSEAVYLTALTGTTSSSGSATPQGGTPPGKDTDPTAWNGFVLVAASDVYTGADTPNPDLSKVTIYWSGDTTNVTGYLVEKKVGMGQWAPLASINSSATTSCQDANLLATEDYQYRVSPYYNSNIVPNNPCEAYSYQVPLIKTIYTQTNYASGSLPYSSEYFFSEKHQFDNGSYVDTKTPGPSPSTGQLQYSTSTTKVDGFTYQGTDTKSYSDPYSKDQFIQDVGASLTAYGAWTKQWDVWGYSYDNNQHWWDWWGWWTTDTPDDYTVDDKGMFWIGAYTSYFGSDYSLAASRYKFSAYPAKDCNFKWAEVFVFDDTSLPISQQSKIIKINNWNINSSGGESPIFEVNPTKYHNLNGKYYITGVPRLTVTNDKAAGVTDDLGFYLDNAEKQQIGSAVPKLIAPSGGTIADQLDYGFLFFITGNGPHGTDYTLTWTGSGNLQVWGCHLGGDNVVQMSSGQVFKIDSGEFSGQFYVFATEKAQPGDSITLTLTSTAPDGTVLGTDTSKFYYSTPTSNFTMPIDEASGSRYRKIALNGIPMADEKPQQAAESDQEKEETYVDALTLSLHHSTTDAYMPVSGSDFSVSARRDFRSQVWNGRYNLKPHEQPDLPFGMCWSSNLATNIKISRNNDSNSTTPDQAIVTDEAGAVHAFIIWRDTNGKAQFFPMPTSQNEAQAPNLETLSVDETTTPVTYTFTRKYGAKLTYHATTLYLPISNDRIRGSDNTTTYQYARLITMSIRWAVAGRKSSLAPLAPRCRKLTSPMRIRLIPAS